MGVFQCWLSLRVFSLQLKSPILAICAAGVLVGWPAGALYLLTPGASSRLRLRGTMRALIGILGGTAGFAASANSGTWKPLLLGTAIAFVLSHLPPPSRTDGVFGP
jgi:hypothetical protein